MPENPEGLDPPEGYIKTAEMTVELLRRSVARGFSPTFRYPPKEYALLISIADIGDHLAVDVIARKLVRDLIRETTLRGLDDCPTAMMLRAALDICGVPVLLCSLKDLGLTVAGPPSGIGRA